jgi:hypothetical protein
LLFFSLYNVLSAYEQNEGVPPNTTRRVNDTVIPFSIASETTRAAALCALAAERSRGDPDYDVLVDHVFLGSGFNSAEDFDGATVHDDSASDRLIGGENLHLFYSS